MSAPRRLKLGGLGLALLLMGSTAFKCSSGSGTLFVHGSSDDGSGNGNGAPVASDFTLQVAPNVLTAGTLRATDPDGDALTFSIVAQPAVGILSLTNAETGAFTYTTSAQGGVDSFSFQASDGQLSSQIAVVTVEIGPGAAMVSLPPPSGAASTAGRAAP